MATVATIGGQLSLLLMLATAQAVMAEGLEEFELRIPRAKLIEVRAGYLDYWEYLQSEETTGLDRFALTVQRIADTRFESHRDEPNKAIRLILDDLVDVFVEQRFRIEKTVAMTTPAVLGSRSLGEEDGDLSGFASLYSRGEGRFRHFALNAAAAYVAPDGLVDLVARLRGGDLVPSSPDAEADRATNRVGREFARLLRETPLAELADGHTVREWIVDRFGGPDEL